jgi:hypothetical protein
MSYVDHEKIAQMPNLVNNEKVFFSVNIEKYNDFGLRQERTFCLTSGGIYNIKKKKV